MERQLSQPRRGGRPLRVQPAFASMLKELRTRRRLTQLDISADCGVSQRHLSVLESGRARPSRATVMRLADALLLSPRERNALLAAAGLAHEYHERSLDDPELAYAKKAITLLLDRLDPCPAIVIDRRFYMFELNAGAERLFAPWIGPPPRNKPVDLIELLNGAGARERIANWDEVADFLLATRERNALVAGNSQLARESRARRAELGLLDRPLDTRPFLPVMFRSPDGNLSFLTAMVYVQAPRDLTLDETRVEVFFPADPATEAWVKKGP